MPRKSEQSSNSNHKILNLLSLFLFNKKEFSLSELSSELDCSKQTILRLVDELDTSGIVQIEKNNRDRQNFYKVHLPTSTNIRFTPDEIQQLLFCRDFLLDMLPTKQKDLLQKASAKANLMTSEAQETTSAGKTLTQGKIDYTNADKSLDLLLKAIASHSVIEIEYQSKNSKEVKTHAFIPVHIVAFHETLYVRAWKTNDKGRVELLKPITFALHRIKNIWLTTRAISAEEFAKTPFPEEENNRIFGMAMEVAPFEVQVKFYPPASSIIQEKTWSYDQKFEEQTDGSLLLTITAQSELEVIKWVLGYGQEAELVSPQHLREKAKAELEFSINRYK